MFSLELGTPSLCPADVRKCIGTLNPRIVYKFVRIDQRLAVGKVDDYHTHIAADMQLPLIHINGIPYAHDNGNLILHGNRYIFYGNSGGIDPIDAAGNIVEMPRTFTPEISRVYWEKLEDLRRTTALMFLGTLGLILKTPEVWYTTSAQPTTAPKKVSR